MHDVPQALILLPYLSMCQSIRTKSSTSKLNKGRGAHSVFKKSKSYFNSSELGMLSTTANSKLGSVDTGAVGAVREEQKQDFDQNQDSGPSYS